MTEPLPVPSPAWRFYKAYRDLSAITNAVTAQSLRNTDPAHGRRWLRVFPVVSEGVHWSRRLWLWTFLTLLYIVVVENLDSVLINWFPADGDKVSDGLVNLHIAREVLLYIMPFMYGLLGACTYLLKSCHKFIHERSFDLNRLPEYYSRMILGLIAGGSILLFIEQIMDDGETINLSSAALAFLAGYNTDFLYSTLERVAAAILPKVGLETVRRQRSTTVSQNVSLERLVQEMQAATDPEDKKAIRDLIDRLKSSLG